MAWAHQLFPCSYSFASFINPFVKKSLLDGLPLYDTDLGRNTFGSMLSRTIAASWRCTAML